MRELLQRLPPMLRIVDAGSGSGAGGFFGVGSPQATAGDEGAGWGADTSQDDDAFMLRDDEPVAVAPTPGIRATPRRQKKPSPLKSVIQIIAGGLVSIPLAIAILLLLKYFDVANPNLGFWPLDGTPFRRTVAATPPPATPPETSPPAEETQGRMLGEDMPEFGDMDPGAQLDQAFEPATDAETVEAFSEQPNPEIETVVNAAKQASTALANHADPATRSGALKELYLQLAKLGELATPAQQSSCADLFAQLRSEDQLEAMGRFGQPWFAAPSRLYEGLFVTGTLADEDGSFRLQWEDGESVLIAGWDASPQSPQEFVGKKVAMLAQIDAESEPRQFLIGYLERLDRDSAKAEQP